MVALHLANVEILLTVCVARGAALGAVGALVVLSLIGRPDLAVVKFADAEVALVAGEQVGVNAAALRHIRVLHQCDRLALQILGVVKLVVEAIVQRPPLDPLHLFAVGREGLLHPASRYLPSTHQPSSFFG